VIGALLVAPPDVEEHPLDRRLTRFAPVPASALPFPSILVASRNDPYLNMAQARSLARGWGSRLADAGEAGHINAQSGLGDWAFGRLLLNTLLPNPLPVAQDIPRALPSNRAEIDPALAWHFA
jgi:predicted alpha/beta hydrolase family esterase